MDFKAAARYLYSLVRRAVGGGGMSLEQATELAHQAHREAYSLFTGPKNQSPGNYPGKVTGNLSDSFTTLVFKDNQKWKMEMGFDKKKFYDLQMSGRRGEFRPVDYATGSNRTAPPESLQERGYRGPDDAMADVGYTPEDAESGWFIQRAGVAVQFQGGK